MILLCIAALSAGYVGYTVLTPVRFSVPTRVKVPDVKALISKVPLFVELQQKRAMSELQDACVAEAPEMFDVLTLGLCAGLSFDASLDLYIRRISTTLACELARTKLYWDLGIMSRCDALRELSQKIDSRVIGRFYQTVKESLEFGLPLSESLMRQSRAIRQDQRYQIEERIEKIPVKLLVPLALLVVPAMLVAILGPLMAGVFMS